jgi:hypothetical protein
MVERERKRRAKERENEKAHTVDRNPRRHTQIVHSSTFTQGGWGVSCHFTTLVVSQSSYIILHPLATVEQTMNLIINLDHDDWILNDMNKTLAEYGTGKCSSIRQCFNVVMAQLTTIVCVPSQ